MEFNIRRPFPSQLDYCGASELLKGIELYKLRSFRVTCYQQNT